MVLFSTITSLNFSYSMHELRGELGTYLLIFFLAVNNLRFKNSVRWIAVILFIASFIISSYGVFEYFFKGRGIRDYVSSLTDVNYLSATLVLLFPYIVSFWFLNIFSNRWIKAGFYLLNLCVLSCLVITHSRGGYMALLVEIIFLGLICSQKKRMWKFLLIFLVSIVLIFTFSQVETKTFLEMTKGKFDISSMERLEVWKFSLHKIANYPFSGIGYGKKSLQKSFPSEPAVKEVKHAHNIFLATALEIGIPGFVCFVWLLLVLGVTLKEAYRSSQDPFLKAFFLASLLVLVGYMVRCQFDHLYVDNLARLFWLLMGTAIGFKSRQ